MNRLLRLLKTAGILAQTGLLAVCAWIALETSRPPAGEPRFVLVDIPKGTGVRAIAGILVKEGVLPKKTPFIERYRFFYSPRILKAGQYRLAAPSSPRAAIEALLEGRVYLHAVTVAEGLTAAEMIPVFLAAGFGTSETFEEAIRDVSLLGDGDAQARDLEGYLFPETYRLPKGTTAKEITAEMVGQFRAVFQSSWLARASELGMSVRDVVTLASLIEKETGLAAEKPLVSAVFHNRLRLGMKLDCDPTIIYALKLAGNYKGRLHSNDLKLDNPYNTYLYRGLPPGPIANPGRESLQAALFPADVDFLYFVSRNDGSHRFSRTFREHNQAVDRYQR